MKKSSQASRKSSPKKKTKPRRKPPIPEDFDLEEIIANPPYADLPLDSISEGDVEPSDDGLYREEKEKFDRERDEILLEDLRNSVTARKAYAAKIYWLLASWLVFVGGVVLLSACPLLNSI